jgi:PAP2 superfamily
MSLEVRSETAYTVATPGRRPAAAEKRKAFALPGRRAMLAVPLVAVVTMGAAVLLADAAGVPVRDPDNVTGNRLVLAISLILALVGLDLVVRAWTRSEGRRITWSALAAVRRENWPLARGLVVASAVIGFYVTYLAYRNLKSVVPLLRPGELFDRRLGDLDRSVFGGSDPAALLHDLLGTGISAHVLAAVYGLFFFFVPVTLALALVLPRDPRPGLFYATALSINWVLAAGSYFLLPSLGPVFVEPGNFAALPSTAVSHLQTQLIEGRVAFLQDPGAAGAAQSIGAFASLHVSIFATAAISSHLLDAPRHLRVVAWVLLALTVLATVYFGWHYVLDDVAGLVIAATALALARALTGFEPRTARRPVPAPNPSPA